MTPSDASLPSKHAETHPLESLANNYVRSLKAEVAFGGLHPIIVSITISLSHRGLKAALAEHVASSILGVSRASYVAGRFNVSRCQPFTVWLSSL